MKRVFKIGVWLSLVAVAIISLSSPAQAGGCGQYFSNYGGYSYYTPSYYPASYTYNTYYAAVVPTPVALFQFVQPAVASTTVTQTTTQTQTQQAAAALVGVTTGATGTTAQTSLISDAQLERLATIMADRIVRGLKAPDTPPPTYSKPPAVPPVPPMPKEEAKAAPKNNAAIVYQAAAIAATSCMECHTKGSEKGKVVLFDEQARFGPSVSPAEIYKAVADDSMPHGKQQKLTTDQKAILKRWADLAAVGS